MQVTESFSKLLFSIRTHFAVDSALLEEFSFLQPPFIVAAHIICKRVSHRSWTAKTVISRLRFSIQSLGHDGWTMRARNWARCSARTHSAPTRAAPRARTAIPRAPLSEPLRTHAQGSLTRRSACTLSTLPQCGCAGPCPAARACGERSTTARASDGRESVIPTHPSLPFPPRHSHLLPLAGLAGGRRCSSRRAPRPAHPATAACGQWPAHVGPRLPARPATAAGPSGPRRMLARPARGGCWHGMPAAAAGTAGQRRLHENGSQDAWTVICPKQTKWFLSKF